MPVWAFWVLSGGSAAPPVPERVVLSEGKSVSLCKKLEVKPWLASEIVFSSSKVLQAAKKAKTKAKAHKKAKNFLSITAPVSLRRKVKQKHLFCAFNENF
jgi:hypothetical protein